jgi:FkbM family methyltransferase
MKAALKRSIAGTALEPVARIWWRRLRVGRETGRNAHDNAVAIQVMKRILRPDSNWIEIGASTGELLWHVVRYAPRGQHHAFEPVPSAVARLRADFGDRVTVHAVACSDESGETEFQHVVGDAGYSGLRRRSYPRADLEVRAIRVRVTKLDDELPADLHVHAMKIDVEGAEMQVLRGASRTLATWRPFVLFEHGTGAAEVYGTTPEALWDLWAAAKYSVQLPDQWLRGGAPLDRPAFAKAFAAGQCNYLACPA